MATAQKRGFRFPWGNDGRRDTPESEEHDVHEQTLAQRIGAVPDDIGRGPFDLATSAVAEAPASDTWDPVGNEPQDEPETATMHADEEPSADHEMDRVEAKVADAAPEPDAPSPATVAPRPPQAPAKSAPTTSPAASAAPAPAPSAWPESDRRANRPAITVAPPAPAPAAPKRDNKLMTGLVRAMRDAAKVARDEAVAALRSDATDRGAAIRGQSVTATAALRRSADGDVAAIREWSKAEVARVREETDARIAARKARLASEIDDAAKAIEGRLAQIAAAVTAYEAETATFFDALLAEDDPARLAGLAERMPSPPPLDEIVAMGAAAPGKGSATPARNRAGTKRRAAGHPAHPRPEAEPRPVDDPSDSEPETVAQHAEPESDLGTSVAPEGFDIPDALDAEAAAAAEAEAFAGLEGHTQVIASGLVGVAAIASFKAALVRCPGINAVSVNAGSDGDVLYSVTHAGDTDIRDALRDMEPFETRLIADDGATLVVVVHEATA